MEYPTMQPMKRSRICLINIYRSSPIPSAGVREDEPERPSSLYTLERSNDTEIPIGKT